MEKYFGENTPKLGFWANCPQQLSVIQYLKECAILLSGSFRNSEQTMWISGFCTA